MKIATITANVPKFELIELRITVESADELLALWHCFNASLSDVKRIAELSGVSMPSSFQVIDSLWGVINKEATRQNLKGE